MKELAQGIASLGRGPDTELVHMTKGEVAGLQSLALAAGGSLTINPHTGLPEAGFLSSILPMLAGVAANAFFPGAGMFGTALAGGLTGMLVNKDKPGMGAITGALGGVGGGNLASTFAGAGESAAATEFAKQAAEAGTAAQQGIMNQPVTNFMPSDAQANFNSPDYYPNEVSDEALKTAQETQANLARQAAENTSTAMPQQSYLDKLQKGISSPPTDFFSKKKNYADMGMAAAPLAMGLFGSGAGSGVGSSGLPYSTSSVPYSKAQASTRTTQFPTYPYAGPEYAYFTGERTYGPGNSLANYGAAEGGLATLKGFADGGMPNSDSNYPNFDFFRPQQRMDPMQQNLNNYGEPEGYAGGGMPEVPARGPIRFNAENSGFFDQMPQRQAPAPSAGIPAAGGYTPFSLYGPGGFKPAAAQVAPPTQAQATAAAPKPAEPAPAPAPVSIYDPGPTTQYNWADGGSVGYAQGGIADLTPTYAAGGKLLRGPGDGVSDSIPAVITGPKPQRAALADGEFVIPARIVSELGNGSTEAGARKLYAMMDRVQHARRKSIGKDKVAVNSRAEKLLPA